jgi:thioredoxin-related protein
MDQKTFSNPFVAQLLNEKFYPVKFNAEQKGEVVFKGHTYRFVSQGRSGYHELAAALLNNQLSYPTVVFLNEDFGMIQPIPGYHEAKEFYQMADFVGSGNYKRIPWADFQKDYKSPF